MKEQGKNSEDQTNKEEIGKPSEKELSMTGVKMTQNLENRVEKIQESMNTLDKNLEEIKNKHTQTNNMITEIKHTLEGINSRITN